MSKYHLRVFILICFFTTGCKKFLDVKSDSKLAVPASLTDLQLLLDNNSLTSRYPTEPELLADNYYITPAEWGALYSAVDRDHYIWKRNNTSAAVWGNAYMNILVTNAVLDQLYIMSGGNDQLRNNIKGTAHFYRGFILYTLAQLFADPFVEGVAREKPGIPLRLDADFNKPTTRASVQQTYEQIISDLEEAARLLPEDQMVKTRPTKSAAYAALARVFLATNNYQQALRYADSTLQSYTALLDYNDLSLTAANPIQIFNKEVIFHAVSSAAAILTPARAKIDSTLIRSYNNNDLRLSIFFKKNSNGTYAFKGDYAGANTGAVFHGLATDEIYLVKAESLARLHKTAPAMDVLNQLLITRWKKGDFVPLSANNEDEALRIILAERRKELVWRGLRWTDLRRLNHDSRFATTLKRFTDQWYTLEPNSNRYTLLIPEKVIEKTGIQQNP